MKYYIDCEFDGHRGPLLSFAIVREDGMSRYLITTNQASDPWVQENVIPILNDHPGPRSNRIEEGEVGTFLRSFIGLDEEPIVIADSPVDITRFADAISTSLDGGWMSTGYSKMTFIVENVDCYPTTLEGAVRHNALWDAMALRHLLMDRDKPIKHVRHDFPECKDVWEFPAEQSYVQYYAFSMKHQRCEPISMVNDGKTVKMHFVLPVAGYVLVCKPVGKGPS